MLQDTVRDTVAATRDTVADTANAVVANHHTLMWSTLAVIAIIVLVGGFYWFANRPDPNVTIDNKRR